MILKKIAEIIEIVSFIGIVIIALLLLANPVNAEVSSFERQLISHRLSVECEMYNKLCYVIYTPDTKVYARTFASGRIEMSKGLLKVLSYDEVLSVGYHEVGHLVLNHFDRAYKIKALFRSKNYMNDVYRQHEYEADKFSFYTSVSRNEKSYLAESLKKITAKKYFYTEAPTHPSTYNRIQVIKSYIKGGN